MRSPGFTLFARTPIFAGLAFLALCLSGCPDTPLSDVGGPCARPGRGSAVGCRGGLTCAYGSCRDACTTSRDCDQGQRCVIGEAATNVCSLPAEASCRSASDCGGSLSCTRGECRTSCESDSECLAGTCASGTCAEPVSMVMPDGSACASEESCMAGSVCVLGRCRTSCSSGCEREGRCLAVGGCSLPDENDCDETSECTTGLVCGDGECRTSCTADGECGRGGRCVSGTCDEPMGTGPIDAGSVRIDAGRIDSGRLELDAYFPGFDGGPRGPQTLLASAFTGNPLPSQTVRVLSSWTSPAMSMRDLVAGSRLAPIHVTLTGRSDADGRGVAYIGAVDGTGAARLFRFPGDAPDAAVDRSSELAAATNVIDFALAEDGDRVRGLLIRERSDDSPLLPAGWTWAEGTSPASYDRRVGVFAHGVYTFGEAAISGGSRSVGADQDLRFLVRERERIATGDDPVRYMAGAPYFSALDVSARVAASDPTTGLFTSNVLSITALHDFALIWDPDTRQSTMLRLREEGAMLRTSYDRLGFLAATSVPPVIAQQHLLRFQALVAQPSGTQTSLHQISCPVASACVSEATALLPTPGGTEATTLAAAPLRNGYALITVDSAGIVLRAIDRDLAVVPGYDAGGMLEPLGASVLSIDGGTYNLMSLRAYAFAVENEGGSLRSVTLLVGGLYADFTARQMRLRVTGVRVELP